MRLICIKERNNELVEQLVLLWKASVKVSHLFLSDLEIDSIEKYVPKALIEVQHLIVIKDEDDNLVAFMGVDAHRLEMLFVAPNQRGKGIGKRLVRHGIDKYAINELVVNEQNPIAVNFYKHMGFHEYKRSELDEQGNPYPILYMMITNKNLECNYGKKSKC